jgi:acetyltransferase-like isoleucine patch superfamily enzyme
MLHPKEFVPEGLKAYIKLVAAKLRYRDCFIGSPHIGDRVTLGRGCSIARGVELGARVTVGDYSYVNLGAIIGSGEIGRFCSIGPYAIVGMPEHPTCYLSTSPRLYGRANVFRRPSDWEEFPDPPLIGSDVWIGASAFVRQGVQIGPGAVVAAGAAVTRDVDPYQIVGGVPARPIRSRFSTQEVEWLLQARWWDLPLAELESYAGCFQSPSQMWPNLARQESEAVHS